MRLIINTVLNSRYSIISYISQGGFGFTYLAEDNLFKEKVCIKELYISGKSTRGENQEIISENNVNFSFDHFLDKFWEEASQLALFNHPNIVKVKDFFKENGSAYMVMEFVEGVSLRQLILESGPLPINNAISLFNQLLDAVEIVHNASMLHRDIKPDNILLKPDQSLVLIDFGSAREFLEGKTLTQTAMLTPGYAPIEQYGSKRQRGAFTDIYALGATLYFMITGVKPIDATDRYAEEMPAPHQLNSEISLQLSSAIMLAMQMRPEDRFQSVSEFRKGLFDLSRPLTKKTKFLFKRPLNLFQKLKGRKNFVIFILSIALISTLLLFYFSEKRNENLDEIEVVKDE
jgi:serine/threonine protein kinase